MGNIQIKRGIFKDLPMEAKEGELLYTTDTKDLFVGNGIGHKLTRINDTGGLNSNVLKSIELIKEISENPDYVIPEDGILVMTSPITRTPNVTIVNIKVNDNFQTVFGNPHEDTVVYQMNVFKGDKVEIKVPFSSILLVYPDIKPAETPVKKG